MNYKKIIYWVSTLIIAIIFIGSSFIYLTKYEEVVGYYEKSGFSTFLVIPVGIMKFLGGIFILFPKISPLLTKLSYLILIAIIVGANLGHYIQGLGFDMPHTIAFLCILTSFFYRKERV